MNDKFYDIKSEKQERIINAAIKVFAENGYKKASTDVIVKEAEISKGLLFHYFTNKIGLYEYIVEYSVRFFAFEMTSTVNKNEHDFFELQMQMEQAKLRIMKLYPYMQEFLSGLKYENDEEAKAVIGGNANALENIYDQINRQADNTKFNDFVVVNRIVNMLKWMSDGYVREALNKQQIDLEEMGEEFSRYLKMMKAQFYKGGSIGVSREDFA